MLRRLKVLMVGPARDERGGIATVLNDYFSAGIEDRCDVTFCACTRKGSKLQKLGRGMSALAWVRRHVRDFDVVHVHMGGGNSFARERLFAMVSVRASVPTILHVHDGFFVKTFEDASPSLKKSYQDTFSSVDQVVVLSKRSKDYLDENVTQADNVVVIPNGIHAPVEICMNKESGTVLFLGHFDDNKNADVLIRAVVKARMLVPNIRCLFGADGDLEGAKALVAKLGVEEECQILGWVGSREKQELLDRCSIYCLPSENEAFPMGLLEAMANGLAAVVTPVGGMRDIVEDGRTGVFVPVGDVDALADALVALIQNETRRASIAEAGSRMVAERYDLDGVLDEVVGIYEELACVKNLTDLTDGEAL